MWNSYLEKMGLTVEVPVKRIQVDSRQVKPGDLFVALNSGWQYIEAAKQKGAVCCIAEKASADLWVADSIAWLMKLASLYRNSFNATVIGVTGSVGKTSTVSLLAQVLSQHGKTHATQGNQNNEIGVALTLLSADLDCKYCVVEMGVGQPGDMDLLVEMVSPDIGILTKIAPSHLDRLGSRENVWLEKKKLLDHAKWRILPKNLADAYQDHTITFGYRDADVVIETQQVQVDHQYYPLPEDIAYRKALYAIAYGLCHHLSLPMKIPSITWPGLRMTPVRHESGSLIIWDCYNANFTSYCSAVIYMQNQKNPLLVLGEMGGLGEKAPYYHQLLGHMLNYFGIEKAYGIGSLHQQTLLTYLGELEIFESAKEFKPILQAKLANQHCILIKGSRHLQLETLLDV